MAFFIPHQSLNSAQRRIAALAVKMRHFFHNEAIGGVFLLLAAAAALILANSPWHELYENLLHMPLAAGAGAFSFRFDAHFIVNDVLMTVFFLGAGVEIRQELHNGALSRVKQAILPLVAAVGGVCLPALIYLGVNAGTAHLHGWAVPTATDIAFAVGILALLGKGIPAQLRVVLLALAIIDDIIAVLIIALFYSGGLSAAGGLIAAAAILAVLLLQFLGFKHLGLYIAAGAVLWFGLWKMGIHPSLAGVALGLLTPVLPRCDSRAMTEKLRRATEVLAAALPKGGGDKKAGFAPKGGNDTRADADNAENINETAPHYARLAQALADMRQIDVAFTSPAKRVQQGVHLWVAFAIMPLFAFVNAGVRLADVDFSGAGATQIAAGVMAGLIIGKPLGIFCAAFLAVKCGLCRLPPRLDWGGMALIGLLGGIGFTMSIFVAMLAYADKAALSIGVLGVLCGSALSAVLGLSYGFAYRRRFASPAPEMAAAERK